MRQLKLTLCGALLTFAMAMSAVVFAPRPAAAAQTCYDTYCSGQEDHCFYMAGYKCNLGSGLCAGNTKLTGC